MQPFTWTQDRQEPARLVVVAVEAPRVPIESALRASDRMAPSFAWSSRPDEDGWSFAGWGVAAAAVGAGEERFDQVRRRSAQLFDRVERAAALPFAPRLFGAFAFAPRERSPDARERSPDVARERSSEIAAAWDAFGDASFVLPRVLYGAAEGRAILAAFAPEPEIAAAARTLDALARALDVHADLDAPRDAPGAPRGAAAPAIGDGGEGAYRDLVARATAEIAAGAFDKVVLCRTRRVDLASDPDLAAAFAHLAARQAGCARFLFAREGATFLGATPERLISLRGRRLATEALAGSTPRRAPREADAAAAASLLASEKDRAEHAFVVRALRAALEPLCDAMAVPAAPEVRTLRHIHHLATPITAALRQRSHILDLARRLHPTPALCGAPREAAAAFLLANEGAPRGWYGGAAGWIDAEGDGALHVAIRSALVASRVAWIYAGAGIVGASDPEAELAETIAKEGAMRDALEAASSRGEGGSSRGDEAPSRGDGAPSRGEGASSRAEGASSRATEASR